jgi:hypothetical protein
VTAEKFRNQCRNQALNCPYVCEGEKSLRKFARNVEVISYKTMTAILTGVPAEMANEIALSDNIDVITAEIKILMKRIEEDTASIGERFKKVRDRDLADKKYGNWGRWCADEFKLDRSTANKIIKVFETFGSEATSPRLGTGKLFEIISLPSDIDRAEFTEESHEIPSTGEKKTVDEMTVKELREVKKALKQTQAERDAERKERERLEREVDREPEIRYETKTEYVDNTDYEAVEKLRKYEERYGGIDETTETAGDTVDGDYRSYGMKLSREMYTAFDELSEWQKKYAWIATDLNEFKQLAEADDDFAREFARLDEFWRHLAGAFQEKGRKDVSNYDVIDVVAE